MQSREVHRKAVDDTLSLLRLHLLPRLLGAFAVEVRMPALHLRDEGRGDVVHRELALFFGEYRVEENLQQQVAELFAQLGWVAGANGIIYFVRFFYEIRTQRLVGLRRVPLAPRAQVAHQRECIFKQYFVFHRLLATGSLPDS
jgi:hypothetical protein